MAAFEVIALDTATPQLRAPGASDTYTFPRAVELPLGTANGVLFLNGSKVVTSGSGLVFDSSGNLGLGVTPSAWSQGRAIEVAGTGYGIWNGTASIYSIANAYFDSVFKYANTGAQASHYYQFQGQHVWSTAASGTAGNAISFTQAMTLDASGDLLVGTTSKDTGSRITIDPDSGDFAIAMIEPGGDTAVYGYLKIGHFSNGAFLGTTAGSNAASDILRLGTGSNERARIPAAGGMVVGTAALATSATDGFLYVPTCAGTPTGTPTTQTGTAPIVVDTTNNKLYFYSGGQWRDAGP